MRGGIRWLGLSENTYLSALPLTPAAWAGQCNTADLLLRLQHTHHTCHAIMRSKGRQLTSLASRATSRMGRASVPQQQCPSKATFCAPITYKGSWPLNILSFSSSQILSTETSYPNSNRKCWATQSPHTIKQQVKKKNKQNQQFGSSHSLQKFLLTEEVS